MDSLLIFIFFKQKTAYELRISDWSSDVCSSDLPPATPAPPAWPRMGSRGGNAPLCRLQTSHKRSFPPLSPSGLTHCCPVKENRLQKWACWTRQSVSDWVSRSRFGPRSEEHTSELQSLMRISYAVFCLKKKKYIKTNDKADK